MIKMKNIYKLSLVFILAISFTSCFDDLNTIPIDKDVTTSEVIYDSEDSYIKVLAKVYAGLAVSGQEGPSGKPDIQGIDEGFGQYLRGFWYHQELPTDEAIIAWNDQTIKDFHDMTWTAADNFTYAFYSRVFYQISMCNEFIRETEKDKLDSRGVGDALRAEIQTFRAEVRFLRALSYWHALDIFRNVPFVTEDDAVGFFFPEQTNAVDLFNYLESDLKAIDGELLPPRSNVYARVDQAAAWMLLAKLYQNAEVYINESKDAECVEYCEKIINAGYSLDQNYGDIFLSDNHNSEEIIFPVAFDGVRTRTWGGMTFIIRAGLGGTMSASESGVASGWGGTRTTKEFVAKFPADLGGVLIAPNEGESHPKIYVPGSHQDWDPTDLENALSTADISTKIYEGYKYFPDDNTEILIAKNPTLGGALGDNGADGTLETGGANIVIAEAGFYFIQVNLTDNTYIIEKTDWGILGDATAGGWDTDEDLIWDEELQALRAVISLNVGEIKFRANDAWDKELGDTGADALLEYGGDNIMITESGTFEVILFLNYLDYTLAINNLSFDSRAYFHTDGQKLEIDTVSDFAHGYAINKFKNVTSNGDAGSDTDYPDTDFPMFRLADAY